MINDAKRLRLRSYLFLLDTPSEPVASELTKKILSKIPELSGEEIFDLGRKYMGSGRPRATLLLRKSIEIELVFMGTGEIIKQLDENNPEELERCFLLEIKRRRPELDAEDVRRVIASLKTEKVRRAFLQWFVGTFNFKLSDLFIIRQFVLYPFVWISEGVMQRELDIVDGAIKTSLSVATDDDVRAVLSKIKDGDFTDTEIPDFFTPLVNKLFWYIKTS